MGNRPEKLKHEKRREMNIDIKKLKALVEAGKRATHGEWRLIFNSSNSRSVRAEGGIIFNAWKPTRYTGQDARYDDELLETKFNCDFIAQAANCRADIEALIWQNEQYQWQPIESAPKDGTFIMLIMAGNNPHSNEPYIPAILRWLSDRWGDDDTDEDWSNWKPTHWMPLPQPPQT